MLVLVLPPCARASAEERPSADFVLNALLHEREALVTGEFTVTGERNETFPEEEDSEKLRHERLPFSSYCAFDWARNFLRYENTGKRRMGVVVGPQADFQQAVESAELRELVVKLRYVRNSEYSAHWGGNEIAPYGPIVLLAPSRPLVSTDQEFHHVFDVRACGLGGYRDFVDGVPPGVLVGKYSALSLAATVGDDGIVVLAGADAEWSYELRVNPREGFTPVQFVRNSRTSDVTEDASVNWQRLRDHWVPVRIQVGLRSAEARHTVSLSLSLDWKSVNEPLPDSTFDYRSLNDIPTTGEVRISDARARPIVDLGYLGSGGQIIPEEQALRERSIKQQAREKRSRLWMILGPTAAILVLMAWFVRHRLRQQPG